MKTSCFFVLSVGLLGAAACGSSHPAATSTGSSNTLAITANSGPPGIGYVNGLFTSVTVCVPGTSSCQVIDYVLVDTGSVGLRILSSATGGGLTLTLPLQTDASGNAIAECTAFIDGYTWGPLRLADVTMGGEQARSVPIQVIGDPGFVDIPSGCSSTGGANEDAVATLGAYAILGVGPAPQDCGGACAESIMAADTANPGNIYYSCPSTGCRSTAVAVEAQVQNPVSLLPVDNNGVMIGLSSVGESGASSATGSLVFGIGTQANNSLGKATVLSLDPDTLTITTVFQGQSYPMSFVDSGSNALYILNSSASGLPLCTGQLDDFYCPATTVAFTAINEGASGATSTVDFSVANAETLFGNSSSYCFDDLAGPGVHTEYFDWGLPFFYGRNVFFAIEGASAPGVPTPYVAY